MLRRGPYKQYEVDASVAVPKSTFYYNRKRRFAEVDVSNAEPEAEISMSDGDDSNEEYELDGDYPFQVKYVS